MQKRFDFILGKYFGQVSIYITVAGIYGMIILLKYIIKNNSENTAIDTPADIGDLWTGSILTIIFLIFWSALLYKWYKQNLKK